MPSAVFVHLSDIHFGQEKGETLHIHNDVKEQVIADARTVVAALPGKVATGILVTGDIAYSGKKQEYVNAANWLDRLAKAVGCQPFDIQMIPGNHDMDRDRLSISGEHVLNEIRARGGDFYEAILSNDTDRAALFARFIDYGKFCEGYDCPLDMEGRHSANPPFELAPGRTLRFVRMNSALLCTGKENDTDPELLVGARQFTVLPEPGEEVVVLIHHPIHWLKDGDAAAHYFKNRARVVISGHEHQPKAAVIPVEPGTDVLMLAAGATVPSKSNEVYTYCYNVIEFAWDKQTDGLAVAVHPRAWNPERLRFESDEKRLGGANPRFVLGCPNFRGPNVFGEDRPVVEVRSDNVLPDAAEHAVAGQDVEGEKAVAPEVEGYRYLLLRFFRDLTEGDRLKILVELGAIESDEDQTVTQAVERRLFDWLVGNGKIKEVEAKVAEALSIGNGGKA